MVERTSIKYLTDKVKNIEKKKLHLSNYSLIINYFHDEIITNFFNSLPF